MLPLWRPKLGLFDQNIKDENWLFLLFWSDLIRGSELVSIQLDGSNLGLPNGIYEGSVVKSPLDFYLVSSSEKTVEFFETVTNITFPFPSNCQWCIIMAKICCCMRTRHAWCSSDISSGSEKIRGRIRKYLVRIKSDMIRVRWFIFVFFFFFWAGG